MSSKTLMINSNVHRLLKEISEQRKKDGNPFHTMSAIISEMTLKQHKKEVK